MTQSTPPETPPNLISGGHHRRDLFGLRRLAIGTGLGTLFAIWSVAGSIGDWPDQIGAWAMTWFGPLVAGASQNPCNVRPNAFSVPSEPGGEGASFAMLVLTNPCPEALNVTVDGRMKRSFATPPVRDLPSTRLRLRSGERRTVALALPSAMDGGWLSGAISSFPDREAGGACFPLQASSGCLFSDPSLKSSLTILATLQNGRYQGLLRVAARKGIVLKRGTLSGGAASVYNAQHETVTIASELDSSSSMVRAAVLAQDLQRMADRASGLAIRSEANCVQGQQRAFQLGASVWRDLWPEALPITGLDPALDRLSDLTQMTENDPRALAAYATGECRRGGAG